MRQLLILATFASASANAQTCESYAGQIIAPVSIETVIAATSKLPSQKDEFETTEQFNARLVSALGTVNGNYIVATKFDPKYAVYDADTQRFKIESYALDNINASWDGVFGYGTPHYGKVKHSSVMGGIDIVVSYSEATAGTYRGTNAFGASTTITKVRRVVKAIYDREAQYGETLFAPAPKRGETSNTTIAELQADAMTAKTLKNSFKSAVVIVPKSPWYGQGKKDWGEPTLDNPQDVDETVIGVIADIQCALITDGSNKVLAAIPTR